MANETVAERYNREWLQLKDDRKVRGFDYQSAERRSREFVDPATVAVAEDGTVTGTVTARHDNEPDGFNRSEFEADLVYDPNA
jgi:hypothetical protein